MSDKLEERDEVLRSTFVDILSELYKRLCTCRKDFPELSQLLDPVFHLEECEYRVALEKVNFVY